MTTPRMTYEQIIAAAQAAGASGIWLLNDAAPHIEYTAPVVLTEAEDGPCWWVEPDLCSACQVAT